MKITSVDYVLPHVWATAAHEELLNSANQPLIITGIDVQSGLKGDYIVKLNASERMHKEARLRELLGAFMAMELVLDVVEPAIITITQQFVDNQLGKPFYHKTLMSLGLNVGSKYLKGFTTLENNIQLTPQQEVAAQSIFAFDLLIQNNDRNYEKPNMITNGKQLIMLDHELAFGFHLVLPFFRNNEPWKFPESEIGWVKKHCLLKRLKGNYDGLDQFSDVMVNINPAFWVKAKELIPDEWFDPEIFETIKAHVDSIIEHKNEYILNLKTLLS